MPPKPFRFVIVSDVHIGSDNPQEGRYKNLPSRALGLLRYLVSRIGDEIKPDFVVQLGNLIQAEDPEEDEENYSKGMDAFKQLSVPVYHLVGNHEQKHLDLQQIRTRLKYQEFYFSFDSGQFHFVVLFAEDSGTGSIRIDPVQREWLEEDLRATKNPTIVFMHHPVDDHDLTGNSWFEDTPERCFVDDSVKVRAVLARSGKVCAVFSGHAHVNHLQSIDDIHYVTIQSLVENVTKSGKTPSESFAVVTLGQNEMRVEIEGMAPAEYRLSVAK